MRYCRFETAEGPRYGRVAAREGELWIDALLVPPSEDLQAQLAAAQRDRASIARERAAEWKPIPMKEATLLTPVTPSKIVCVGRNYRDHANELGNEVPPEPLLFLKPPSSLLPPGGVIRLPAQSQRVDFEGEMAVVVGKECRAIAADEDVRRYIRGYTIVNDVTARDLQKSDGQWSRAKGFDTFCPVGPVVTDEVNPEEGINLETRLNGELRQQGNTRDFLFSVAALLRHIAASMTLFPGDLVPTGTPAGVAPMKAGDTVEIFVERIGTLRNSVAS